MIVGAASVRRRNVSENGAGGRRGDIDGQAKAE